MARIRSIKPEFWSDERLARVPPWVRLLFIGLWNVADEEGRLRGSSLYIRAQVFPYDEEVDVGGGLQMLAELGRIVRYEEDGEAYIWIAKFTEHQRVDPRLSSKLPAPPTQVHSNSSGQIAASPAQVDALRSTSFDGLGAQKSAPSREQVAGGREQVAGGRESAGAPPGPVEPTLQDLLDDAFLAARSSPFGRWRSADENALRSLLQRADSPEEIVTRWQRALAHVGFPSCSTIADLDRHWQHFAGTGPPQRPTAGKDGRKAPVRAEDIPKSAFAKDGPVEF